MESLALPGFLVIKYVTGPSAAYFVQLIFRRPQKNGNVGIGGKLWEMRRRCVFFVEFECGCFRKTNVTLPIQDVLNLTQKIIRRHLHKKVCFYCIISYNSFFFSRYKKGFTN